MQEQRSTRVDFYRCSHKKALPGSTVMFVVTFCDSKQHVRVAQHDALPSTLDQALLLPRTEDPAYGMQGGAGHLGDVLPADWKIDLHAMLDLAAGLFSQAQ